MADGNSLIVNTDDLNNTPLREFSDVMATAVNRLRDVRSMMASAVGDDSIGDEFMKNAGPPVDSMTTLMGQSGQVLGATSDNLHIGGNIFSGAADDALDDAHGALT